MGASGASSPRRSRSRATPPSAQERRGSDVRPHLTGGKLDSTSKVLQQGYVAVKGRYFYYPAVQVTPGGGAAMVGTLSGNDLFPSAAYTTLTAGALTSVRCRLRRAGLRITTRRRPAGATIRGP